jgi:alpha-amylase/alpha-mannosidase (GH57 family)
LSEATRPLDFVLVWHMHQPDYRDPSTGEYRLPWVYLHALKDYSDMAAHLEAHPAMRAVVNLVPVLLDQLEDYASQFAGAAHRDPLLRAFAKPIGTPYTAAERDLILVQCFPANREHLVEPYAGYRRLCELRDAASGGDGSDRHRYLSDRFFADALVWYHLAWTGETVRRLHPLIGEMMELGGGFGEAHRRALFAVVQDIVVGIVARYRRLAEAGIVELTTSPWKHPIGPLLIDFACAHDAAPGIPLPAAPRYPGGLERCEHQIECALDAHAARFGAAPLGVWPAEGAVSDAFAHALDRQRVRWTASGSQVLARSLARAGIGATPSALYRAYRLPGSDVACVFRDDALSDLIGFEYRRWHSGEAARHFVGQLDSLAERLSGQPGALVTVIVDGENAWEYYPYNGFYFVRELYALLSQHRTVRVRTLAEWLERADALREQGRDPIGALPGLVAGSWVYGDLTTWIGSADKNRAWDLLCAAKAAFDEATAQRRLDRAQRREAAHLLSIAESSDWFWWFGDYNPAESVAHFDRLFRTTLSRIYAIVGRTPPPELGRPVSVGRVDAQFEGAIRRAS